MTNLELFTSIFGTERAMSVSWWAEEVSDKTIENLRNSAHGALVVDGNNKNKKGKKNG